MNIHRSIVAVMLLAISLVSHVSARSAPNYQSLRALSMGNAFVAVADDYNTIYYNPAGLNNIDKLGNYEERPDLGYYKSNWWDMKTSLRGVTPDLFGIGLDFTDFYQSHEKTFQALGGDSPEQALSEDTTLYNDAAFLDGITVPIGFGQENAFAMHNFGAALWMQTETAPKFDTGILIPAMKLTNTYLAVEGQLQGAFEVDPQLAIGVGYRMLKFIQINEINSSVEEVVEYQTNPSSFVEQPEIDNAISEVTDSPLQFDHGFDIGAIYQYNREVRLGGALTNIFINGINEQRVTPNFTLGMVYSPRKLQKNTLHGRKLNFALDFADLLNSDRNYKFFSKINFGTEMEWTLLALPFIGYELLEFRVAGGFKGGYWTAGGGLKLARFVHLAAATWAEEDGFFTGQSPSRRYSFELAFGF